MPAAEKAMCCTFIMKVHRAFLAIGQAKLVQAAVVTLYANALTQVSACHSALLNFQSKISATSGLTEIP
jgi:hypothetical protein